MAKAELPPSESQKGLLGQIIQEQIAAGIYDTYRMNRLEFAERVRTGKSGYIPLVADESEEFAYSELPLLPHLYVGEETMIELERVDPDTLKTVSYSVANDCRIGRTARTPEGFLVVGGFSIEQVALVYKHAHLLGDLVSSPYV